MLNPVIKAIATRSGYTKAIDVLMQLESDLNEIGFEPSGKLEQLLKELDVMFDVFVPNTQTNVPAQQVDIDNEDVELVDDEDLDEEDLEEEGEEEEEE